MMNAERNLLLSQRGKGLKEHKAFSRKDAKSAKGDWIRRKKTKSHKEQEYFGFLGDLGVLAREHLFPRKGIRELKEEQAKSKDFFSQRRKGRQGRWNQRKGFLEEDLLGYSWQSSRLGEKRFPKEAAVAAGALSMTRSVPVGRALLPAVILKASSKESL